VPADQTAAASARLVKAGLWVRRAAKDGGGFEIVNWLAYQPSRQQVQTRHANDDALALRRQLHAWLHKTVLGRAVRHAVDARDGLDCRYCKTATVVTAGDRRSAMRRTYDLIDPLSEWDMTTTAVSAAEMERLIEMWAVACGYCNALKGSRTPEEADMTLTERP
jgi:5-methylcytosine-specific restriction endonuclease McrA